MHAQVKRSFAGVFIDKTECFFGHDVCYIARSFDVWLSVLYHGRCIIRASTILAGEPHVKAFLRLYTVPQMPFPALSTDIPIFCKIVGIAFNALQIFNGFIAVICIEAECGIFSFVLLVSFHGTAAQPVEDAVI